METLKQTGSLLAWLSGTIAGISAILYAFGYIATMSYQSMLGFDWEVASRSPTVFLALGGLVLGQFLFDAQVPLLAILAGMAALRALFRGWSILPYSVARRTMPILSLIRFQILPWVLAGAIVYWLSRLAISMQDVYDLKAILFQDQEVICNGTQFGLLDEIVGIGGDSDGLVASAHRKVSTEAAITVGLVLASIAVIRGQPKFLVIVLINFIAAANVAVNVPIVHGRLSMPVDLHPVVLSAGDSNEWQGERYLIVRTQNGTWFWEPERNGVHWVGETRFNSILVTQRQSIASIMCKSKDQIDQNTIP